MKVFKKAVSILLVFLMILSIFTIMPISASAAFSTDTIAVFFTDSNSWDGNGAINVHYWIDGAEDTTTWPGLAMTYLYDNEPYHQSVYGALIPANADRIIFNQGSQSDTIESGIVDGAWWYVDGTTPVATNGALVAAQAADCETAGNYKHYELDGNYYTVDYTVDGGKLTATTADAVTIPTVAHTLIHHEAAEATLNAAGNSEYWSCDVCGKYFSDAEGTTEIVDHDSVVIAALGQTVTVTTTAELTDALADETVVKIILGDDITPPNQVYNNSEIADSQTFVITRAGDLTIDLAGHTISGSNKGTGDAKTEPTSATSTGSMVAGVLSLHNADLNLSLIDSAGGGAIENTYNKTGYIIVCNPATLSVNGVTLLGTNGNSIIGIRMYTAGESHVTVDNTVIDCGNPFNGYVGKTYTNSTMEINSGTFTSDDTIKRMFGNSTNSYKQGFGTLTINGGTFIETTKEGFFGSSFDDGYCAKGGTFYGGTMSHIAFLTAEGYCAKMLPVPPGSDMPGDYYYVITDDDSDFAASTVFTSEKSYTPSEGSSYYPTATIGITSGTDAGVLIASDTTKDITRTINVYDNVELTKTGYGGASGVVDNLIVNVAEGKTVTGAITTKLATVQYTGEGTFDVTVTAVDGYEVTYDAEAKKYTSDLSDSEVAVTLTSGDGSIVRKYNSANADNAFSTTSFAAGYTLKLFENVDTTKTIPSSDNRTVDLNGHTLKYKGSSNDFIQMTSNNKTVSLIDTSENKGGVFDGRLAKRSVICLSSASTSSSAYPHFVIGAGVKVLGCVMVCGKSILDVYGTIEYDVSGDCPLNCNSGWGKAEQVITLHSGSLVKNTMADAIYKPQHGTLNIEAGATVIGKTCAISFRQGTLNIEGGTFTATAGPAIKIEAMSGYAGGVASTITGGTFSSPAGTAPIQSTATGSGYTALTGFVSSDTKGDIVLSEAIDPACIKAGYCQYDWENNTKTVAPHTLTATPAVAATCTTAGSIAYWHCSNCDKYFSDAEGTTEIEANSWVINATGHALTAHPAVAATCTTAGNSAYWECDTCHEFFSDENGENVITDHTSVVIGALGHNMTAHAAVAATCTTAGNSAYWSCDQCNKFFSDAEGATPIDENSWVINATGHAMTEHPAVAATCTTAGNSAYWECGNCHKFFSDAEGTTSIEENSWIIPADGHNMTAHAAVAATCTTAGNSAYWSCDKCNKFFSDAEGTTSIEENSWVINATGHAMTEHPAVAATCTAAGNSAYWSCDKCNKFFSDAEGTTSIEENSWIIPADGHNMTAHAAVAATCTTAGNSAYWSCDKCNKFFSDAEGTTSIEENSWIIPANGHSMTHHPAVAVTATTDGSSEYWSCSACNKYFSDENGENEIDENSWIIPFTGVASVGTTNYKTFAEAVTAANGVDTITLKTNYNGTYEMAAGTTLIVDKNGFTFNTPTVEGAYVVKTSNTDTVYTYTTTDAVWMITSGNTVTYADRLQDLTSRPADGSVITLLKDASIGRTCVGSYFYRSFNVTIDLDGHTLTSTNSDSGWSALYFHDQVNDGTLTVKNGTFIVKSGAANAFHVRAGQTLNLDSTLTVDATSDLVQIDGAGATLNTAANMTTTSNYGIVGMGNDAGPTHVNVTGGKVESADVAIYQPQDGEVNITGGVIEADCAIYAKCGDINISGGTLNATGAAADYDYNGSGCNPTGDAIIIDSCGYPGGIPSLNISGNPTITSANGVQIGDYTYGDNEEPEITSTVNTLTLPTGQIWVETATEGVYEIAEAVAEVEGTGYATFAAAVTAANGTKAIKLLKDYNGTYEMAAGTTLIVDKNGFTFNTPTVQGAYVVKTSNTDTVYTYTTTDAVWMITSGNTVTYADRLQDLTSRPADGSVITLLKDASIGRTCVGSYFYRSFEVTIDLDGHTLTSTNSDSGWSALYFHDQVNDGTLTVKNGTFIVKSGAANAFHVRAGQTLNLDSTLTVDATSDLVQIDGAGAILNTAANMTTTSNYGIVGMGNDAGPTTVNVTGGKVESADVAIYQPQDGEVNITGGVIEADCAIYAKCGDINISGGTLTATGAAVPYDYNGSGCNPTGDAIIIDSCGYPGGIPSLNISGNPTITSANGVQIGDYTYGDNEEPEITSTVNTLTLPTGQIWVETATEGVYEIAEAVAEVEGTGYATFAAAVTAANGTKAIKLLKDYDGTYEMAAGTTLIVDKNGFTFKTPTVEGAYVVKTSNTDTVYTYTTTDAVWMITSGNTVTYADRLQDLTSRPADGSVITLLKDASIGRTCVGSYFYRSFEVTIDLDGHTLTSTNSDSGWSALYFHDQVNDGTLTVKNGTFEVKSGAANAFHVRAGQTLNLDSTLTVDATSDLVQIDGAGATLNTAATMTTTSHYGIVGMGNDAGPTTVNVTGGKVESADVAIYQPQAGTVTVSGGVIEADCAIYAKCGDIYISGGTLNATGAAADYDYNGSGCNPTGDAIIIDSCGYPGGIPSLNISGNPTITSEHGVQIGDYTYGDNEKPEVVSTTNALTLPAGQMWVTGEESGTYVIAEAAASVDGTLYETFTEAVTEANNGEKTVVLLQDVAAAYTLEVGETLKVEKGNFTLTVNAPANYILNTSEAEGVTTYTSTAAAAKIGDVLYATFAEAVTAANGEQTIVLLADYDGTYEMTAGQTLIVDKNGFTFNKPTVQGDYIVNSSNSGTVYTYSTTDAVWMLTSGSTVKYATRLQDLTSNPANGAVITLLKDASIGRTCIGSVLSRSFNITIDLDGHTLTSTNSDSGWSALYFHDQVNDGTLTVKNGTFEVKSGAANAFHVRAGQTLNLDSTLTVDATSDLVQIDGAGATLNTAATMTTTSHYGIVGMGNDAGPTTVNVTGGKVQSADVAIYQPQDGEVNITGGVIKADCAIYAKSGEIKISGEPTITSTGAVVGYNYNGSGCNPTGDAIVIDSCGYPGGAPSLNISGTPNITANGAQVGDYTYGENEKPEVVSTTNALTLPEGQVWIAGEESGTYVIAEAVAEVEGTGYATFAEAVTTADGTKTITLLKDYNGTYEMTAGDTLIVDKNGFTFNKPTVEGAYIVNSSNTGTVYTYTTTDAIWMLTSGETVKYTNNLQSLLSSPVDGSVITLLKDASIGRSCVGGALTRNFSITIDLGGHKLTSTNSDSGWSALYLHDRATNATLTVKNGTFEVKNGAANVFHVRATQTLTLESTLTVNATSDLVQIEGSGATLNTAATMTTTSHYGIVGMGNDAGPTTVNVTGGKVQSADVAIYQPQNGEVNISGGEIKADCAIYAKSGEIKISGEPTITSTGAVVDYTYNGSGCNPTGDAIVIDSCGYPGGAPSLNISGTPNITANGVQIGDYTYGENEKPEVVSTTNELSLPAGQMWVNGTTAGTYVIAEAAASVDNILYETFTGAVEAANNGEKTVVLLQDVTDAYTLTAGETLKVAKGDFTLTVNAPADYILNTAEEDGVTTYTSTAAAAKIGDVLYVTFADAVEAANDEDIIVLLTNITDAYTLTVGETLKVEKGNFTLTVNAPADYILNTATEEGVTTYTSTAAAAKIGDTLYATFTAAVTAANGEQTIVLLQNVIDAYTLTAGETLKVAKGDFTLTVNAPVNYILNTAEEDGVTTYTSTAAAAKIGDTLYATFAAAAAARTSYDDVIILLTDITDEYEIAADEILMVALNGKELVVAAPEGYTLNTSEAEDITTYTCVDCAARIGNVFYTTLADAFNAAQAGDTIVVMTDTSYDTMIVVNKHNLGAGTITLDLNGKNVTYTGSSGNGGTYAIDVKSGSDLTITGGGKFEATNAGVLWLRTGCKLTVDGEDLHVKSKTITVRQERTANIEYDTCEFIGGTYESTNNLAFSMRGDGNTIKDATIISQANTSLLFSGETTLDNVNINSNVKVGENGTSYGDVTITGGTQITGTEQHGYSVEVLAGSKATIDNAVITGKIINESLDREYLTVSGGTFKDEFVSTYQNEACDYEITGGVHYVNPKQYLSQDYAVEVGEDGDGVTIYTVVPAKVIRGGVGYCTVAEAFAEAEDGDTITVLESHEFSDSAVLKKGVSITLDLNGKDITYTGTGNAFELTEANNQNHSYLTVNNAANVTAPNGGIFHVRGYNHLTVNGGTFVSKEKTVQSDQNTSTIVLNGGTYTSQNNSAFNVIGNGPFTVRDADIISKSTVGFSGVTTLDHVTINAGVNASANSVITLTGGTHITYASGYSVRIYGGGKVIVDDAIIDGIFYNSASNDKTHAVITGGTFKKALIEDDPNQSHNPTDYTVQGGTFYVNPQKFVTEDYAVVQGVDDEQVTIYTVVPSVAAVNGIGYAAFAEAAEARTSNDDVIKLYADIEDTFTMTVGETLKVEKGDFNLTVNAPANYILNTSEAEGVTTYTSTAAEAKIGDTLYATFAAAAEDRSTEDDVITLLTDISDEYTIEAGDTLKVDLNGKELSVAAPANYVLNTVTEEGITTYTSTGAAAKIGDTAYATFAEAAEARTSNDDVITLLDDIDEAFAMAADTTMKVEKDDFALTVTGPEKYTISQATTDGVTTYTCSKIKYSATLSLQDCIDINFYVKNLPENFADYTVTYAFLDDEVTVHCNNIAAATENRMSWTVVASCTSRQMSQNVQIIVKDPDGNIIKVIEEYSVKIYCENQLNKPDSSVETKNLCKAVEIYGNEAQNFFSDDGLEDVIAESQYDISALADVPEDYDVVTSGDRNCVKALSASLSLASRTELNFYITPNEGKSINDLTIKVDGVEITTASEGSIKLDSVADSDGRYKLAITGISPIDLDYAYTVTISDGNTSRSITYSPLTYAYRNQSKVSRNAICKALYNYYLAAEAYYVASQNQQNNG